MARTRPLALAASAPFEVAARGAAAPLSAARECSSLGAKVNFFLIIARELGPALALGGAQCALMGSRENTHCLLALLYCCGSQQQDAPCLSSLLVSCGFSPLRRSTFHTHSAT